MTIAAGKIPVSRALPRSVLECIREVLEWNRAVASVERIAHGSGSPLAGVLHSLRSGILGTGCRGTKGVGGAPPRDLDAQHVDPIAAARYRALRGVSLRFIDAVIVDGQGEALVAVPFAEGRSPIECTLCQRLGLRLAPLADQADWYRRIYAKDSRPALAAAEDYAYPRLVAAAADWRSSLPNLPVAERGQ